MKYFVFVIIFVIGFEGFSQQKVPIDSLYRPDPFYLEDQLYFGISYIALRQLPSGLKQNGFSNSIKFGYVRDIPINEERNFGFALGVGYGHDAYYQNLRISIDEETGKIVYQVLNSDDFRSNSFSVNKIDFPFEVRWRGSTPTQYKFWRLYSGITASYVISTSSNFVTKLVNISYSDIKIINPWQFGLTLSAGYNTWNFNFYYGLSNIIKDGITAENISVNMKEMRFGVIYYFL